MPQSLSKLFVHIIFSTKDRFPFFTDENIKQETILYISKCVNNLDSQMIQINIVKDHIHLLCNLSKIKSISELVAEIKRSSSLWLKTKGGKYSKFYWQRGYGAFSVSESQKDKTIQYIKNQENHHNKISFKDEMLKFLEKNKIKYNLEYLWD
ncbi:MAG: IS200/IS605 family transposase [Candidatus Cloacimonadota bacterium]|nr:IS200/IS605 family transposase [Candidatus Cloacimonadota bacterium]